MGTPVFGIFGGLVGYAVGKTDYPAIASWRLLFIIIGGLTTVWGIILFFIFPSDPSSARFLSPEERVAASYLVSITSFCHIFGQYQTDTFYRPPSKVLAGEGPGSGIRFGKL
jgi:Na+-driven multidrug efflux pump